MQGSLDEMDVIALVQHACQNEMTAVLQLKHQAETAEIYFESGQVVHAVLGESTGEDAFYKALTISDGEFSLQDETKSKQQTIERSWPGLLLEGARRIDEGLLTEGGREQSSADLPQQGTRIEQLLIEIAIQIKDLTAIALVQANGKHIASFKTKADIDLDKWLDAFALFAQNTSPERDRKESRLPTGELLHANQQTDMLYYLEGPNAYLAIQIDQSESPPGDDPESLYTLGLEYVEPLISSMTSPQTRTENASALVFINAAGDITFASRQLVAISRHNRVSRITGHSLADALSIDAEMIQALVEEMTHAGMVRRRVLATSDGKYLSCTGVAILNNDGTLIQGDLSLVPLQIEAGEIPPATAAGGKTPNNLLLAPNGGS